MMDEHVVVAFLTIEDIVALFAGLDSPTEVFKVEKFWENSYNVSKSIANRTFDGRYKDFKNVFGDIGEMFVGAILNDFPTAFKIRPGQISFCEPGQKGYDIEARHAVDDGLARIQVKFHNPFKSFGEEDSSEARRALDSFVQSTVVDGEIYYKRHRILITTSREIDYRVGEVGYPAQMMIYTLADLNAVISGNLPAASNFWHRLQDYLLITVDTKIPLPSPVVPYQEQLDDINMLVSELQDGNATLIAPVGTGKNIIGIEIANKVAE
jgi:hypothetical protein